MSEGENDETIKKIAAATLLLQQQQVILTKFISRSEPQQRLEVIDRQNFHNFMSSVNIIVENNGTENYFGLSAEAFRTILQNCRQYDRVMAITPTARLAIFMKYCREGRSQNSLARDLGISQSTVSRIVSQMINDLSQCAPNFIKLPTTRRELETLEQKFFNLTDKQCASSTKQ